MPEEFLYFLENNSRPQDDAENYERMRALSFPTGPAMGRSLQEGATNLWEGTYSRGHAKTLMPEPVHVQPLSLAAAPGPGGDLLDGHELA
jgi:hypothetical protein